MSVLAHFFVVVCGSLFHERLAHFFVDIYTNGSIRGLKSIQGKKLKELWKYIGMQDAG